MEMDIGLGRDWLGQPAAEDDFGLANAHGVADEDDVMFFTT